MATTMLPPARPRMSSAELERELQPFQIDRAKFPMLAVVFRAYYRDTMGRKGVNDRSIYDDAWMLVTPNLFMAVNANADPSAAQGTVTGRASLEPGFWPMWKLDLHRGQYLAFCQRAVDCIVRRDNTAGRPVGEKHPKWGTHLGNGRWRGWFGINGHRGGRTSTSSEGCITTPEPQWSGLLAAAEAEARRLWAARWKQAVIPCVLIDKS